MAPNRILLISCLFAGFLLIDLPAQSNAARILGFFSTFSKSHLLIHCSIADALANAGHEVTVLGGLPNVYKNAKYKYIHIGGQEIDNSFATKIINEPKSLYKTINGLLKQIQNAANTTMSNPIVKKFLSEHGKGSFDVVFIGYFLNEFQFGLGAHFQCPIIVSTTVQPMYSINKLIGNPDELSFVPTLFSHLKQPFNFFGRVKNFVHGTIDRYLIDSLIESHNKEMYDTYFPSTQYPSLEEVKQNISLVFTNHHGHSQGVIRPNVPALIEIGGIQIKENPDPLPADIAAVLEESKEGVIYFSLGTNVHGNVLSESIVTAIFNTLSKLPYKVLWKWSGASVPGSSPNILFSEWLPQDEILAHPNLKLFITHAGQGSVVESQNHGVPMVAIPLFGDQPANAANIESSGFGVKLDYLKITDQIFRDAILEVINNEKYTKAVKQFSKLYRDRPMTQRQSVVYWTEYIIRHGGAKHLQSPSVHLNQFQILSLDVLAFLTAILALVIFSIAKCFGFCFRQRKNLNYQKLDRKIK